MPGATAFSHTDDPTLLARLDERSGSFERRISDLEQSCVRKGEMQAFELRLTNVEKNKVSCDQFIPVRMIVFGAAALAMTSIVGLLLNMALKSHTG